MLASSSKTLFKHRPPSAVDWPLSLQLTPWLVVHAGVYSSAVYSLASLSRQPIGPSSAVAWPLSLQLTRQPIGPSFVATWSVSRVDSAAKRSRLCCRHDSLRSTVRAARLALSLAGRFLDRSSLSQSHGGPSPAPAGVEALIHC